jgi:hypothetical protein
LLVTGAGGGAYYDVLAVDRDTVAGATVITVGGRRSPALWPASAEPIEWLDSASDYLFPT